MDDETGSLDIIRPPWNHPPSGWALLVRLFYFFFLGFFAFCFFLFFVRVFLFLLAFFCLFLFFLSHQSLLPVLQNGLNRYRRSITRIIVFTEPSPPFTESHTSLFTYMGWVLVCQGNPAELAGLPLKFTLIYTSLKSQIEELRVY